MRDVHFAQLSSLEFHLKKNTWIRFLFFYLFIFGTNQKINYKKGNQNTTTTSMENKYYYKGLQPNVAHFVYPFKFYKDGITKS